MDAMGYQTEIAKTIVAGVGDYILAVKANQPSLHEGVVDHFLDQINDDFARVEVSRHETNEKGNGREEHRTYYVPDAPAGLADARRWKGLKQIGMAVSQTKRGGKECDEVRYFILSRKLSARRFGTPVRSDWGIENSLHWQLDVSFGEDQSRTRKDHAAANLGGLRRTALSLLNRETSEKVGVQESKAGGCMEHRLFAQSAIRNIV